MKSIALVLLIIQLAVGKPWYTDIFYSSDPTFCKGRECPEYTLVEQYDGFELREYNQSVWMNAKMPEMETDFWESRSLVSVLRTYSEHFAYMMGYNSQKQMMEMTVPLLYSHTKDTVCMGYMVPREFTSSPPEPLSSNLKRYDAPKGSIYVRSFRGYAYGVDETQNYFKNCSVELREMLDKKGFKYNKDMFFTAVYNSPWDVFNRHNEVWYIKE